MSENQQATETETVLAGRSARLRLHASTLTVVVPEVLTDTSQQVSRGEAWVLCPLLAWTVVTGWLVRAVLEGGPEYVRILLWGWGAATMAALCVRGSVRGYWLLGTLLSVWLAVLMVLWKSRNAEWGPGACATWPAVGVVLCVKDFGRARKAWTWPQAGLTVVMMGLVWSLFAPVMVCGHPTNKSLLFAFGDFAAALMLSGVCVTIGSSMVGYGLLVKRKGRNDSECHAPPSS